MDPGHRVAAGADGAVAQPGKGGILYCVVARAATVLARLSLVKILQVISTAFSGAIVVGLSEIAVPSSHQSRHIGPSHSSSFN